MIPARPLKSGIRSAVLRANACVEEADRISEDELRQIADQVTDYCRHLDRMPDVEEVQDQVERQLMVRGHFELCKHYITYRYTRALVRQSNTTDDRILSLIDCSNEEAKQENANKNPVINSTQRDYMAGEVSRDLTERLLLPEDIVKAHEEGLIHFHDMDYYAQHMHNCDLVNLEDMLQNGTVITGTLIEKPHSFSTACNIATQIIAQVASNQYGGQSISLAHLAPFVQVSREKIRRELDAELTEVGVAMDEKAREQMVERRLREEVKRGVQTIHVTEPINAFDKIAIESRFQALSPGGAISYVEVPNMTGNLEAVLQVMRFIYDNILYAELNTKSDYCQVCGWDGEIEIWEDDGKLVWVCPRCGNRDQNKMNVARRTCGYIGTQFWNQGRTQEIKERVLHL